MRESPASAAAAVASDPASEHASAIAAGLTHAHCQYARRAKKKVAQYRIHVDTGAPLPAGLVAHVESVVKKPRARDETPPPNAEKIVARRRYAAQQNEKNPSKAHCNMADNSKPELALTEAR